MNSRLTVITACLVLLGAPQWCTRAEDVQAEYGLGECLQFGLRNNATLRNAQRQTLITREEIERANAVYDPKLALSAQHTDSELPTIQSTLDQETETTVIEGSLSKNLALGSTIGVKVAADRGLVSTATLPADEPAISSDPRHTFSTAVTFSQQLWKNIGGALTRAREQEAQHGHEASVEDYQQTCEQVAESIFTAYWDAYEAQKTYEVNQQSLERARGLLKINRGKFEDGLIDETEILAAEAALATREVQVLGTHDAAWRTRDIVKEVIGLPHDAWDQTRIVFRPVPESSTAEKQFPFLKAYETAMVQRPDLAALKSTHARILSRIDVTRQELRPDLKVNGSYGRGSAGESWGDSFGAEETVWGVGLSLEMPWSRQKEKAELRQAEIQLEQTENRIEELSRRIERECRVAARELTTAFKRVAATKKARDLQARKLELEEKKLEQGRSTTHMVLEYQDDLDFADKNQVLALSQLQMAQVEYDWAQGILLRDRGLAAGTEEDVIEQ